MLIVSIGLIGILSVINLTVANSANPIVQHQALAIAESYLEEITLQAYSGTSSSARANYDDVDDYHGLSDTGVRDQNGNAIASLSQYNVAVTVSAAMTLSGGVNAKKVSVTVTGPGATSLTLVGYRANY